MKHYAVVHNQSASFYCTACNALRKQITFICGAANSIAFIISFEQMFSFSFSLIILLKRFRDPEEQHDIQKLLPRK